MKDVCSQIAVFASSKTYLGGFRTSACCFKMPQRRFKPLQIRFRMHLGRFQRRYRSVQAGNLIFKGCMQPNHSFCKLQEVSRGLQEVCKLSQDGSKTHQTVANMVLQAPRTVSKTSLKCTGSKLDFSRMYAANLLFLQAPRHISGASGRL